MNKIILSYFFNFYKGYTNKSTTTFEFYFYSLVSTFILSFTFFCILISILFILNFIFNLNILIDKQNMYIYMLILFLLTYYYIYQLNKVSKKNCCPEDYFIRITKNSKFISYSSFIIIIIICVMIAKFL